MIWTDQLAGFTNDVINQALAKCVDKFVWPPEIAEFKQLCNEVEGPKKIPWSSEVLKFTKPKNERYTDSDVKGLIDNGAEICKVIKQVYPELNCYEIADKFTKLKNICRTYHPGLADKELLLELVRYTKQDITDCLEDPRSV